MSKLEEARKRRSELYAEYQKACKEVDKAFYEEIDLNADNLQNEYVKIPSDDEEMCYMYVEKVLRLSRSIRLVGREIKYSEDFIMYNQEIDYDVPYENAKNIETVPQAVISNAIFIMCKGIKEGMLHGGIK